jgi:pimeloyl-ACP methyl ester carboxylesterase
LGIAALLSGFSAHAAPLQTDDCLFNWAERQYPSLFPQAASAQAVSGVYTYRYFPSSKSYLAVSSADQHVYYQGPDGKMLDEGRLTDWLPLAGCPVPAPPQVDCLFNWAERAFPALFLPVGSPATVSTVYSYRYYAATKTWLWVSSLDNHVYFMGPDQMAQDLGPVSDWLPNAGCQNAFGKPSFPIIFMHGLNSSAQAWAEPSSSFKDFLSAHGGWTFGGSPVFDVNTKTVNGILGSGDFYTVDFSGNAYFGLDVQGGELSAVIQAVLAKNPGKSKVILVAHSMGGLVAREYVQSLSKDLSTLQYIPYRGDVDKLITVGTPHQGSDLATICTHYKTLCEWLGYDFSSAAIADLRPGSRAINTLNDLQAHPLPSGIGYYSILGRGADTLFSLFPLGFQSGDFIVTLNSQNLGKIAGSLQVNPQSVTLDIVSQGFCDYQGIAVLHSCETIDPNVWQAILLDL